MKRILSGIILFVLIFLTGSVYCQSPSELFSNGLYNGEFNELYLYRQPSARSEAMGRVGVANTDGDFGSFYNPALTSLSHGINFNSSFSSPYYRSFTNSFYIDSSKFNYFGVSYSNPKLGSFGFSRYFWTLGTDIVVTDETGAETGRGRATHSIYNLNYSREVIKDLFAGINIGLAHVEFPSVSVSDPVTLDIGLLKKFNLSSLSNNKISHSMQLGIAGYNITNSSLSFGDSPFFFSNTPAKSHLPVIAKAGGNYILKLKGSGLIPNGNLIESSTNIEFQSVVNEGYDKILKFGEEIIISEIFALRFGYFTQKLDTHNDPNNTNASSQSQFTYGGGLDLPLQLIFGLKKPLNLKIDYVNMKPPSFINPPYDYENFNTFAFSINWQP